MRAAAAPPPDPLAASITQLDRPAAGARDLQSDIQQHMILTKTFFERTFGAL